MDALHPLSAMIGKSHDLNSQRMSPIMCLQMASNRGKMYALHHVPARRAEENHELRSQRLPSRPSAFKKQTRIWMDARCTISLQGAEKMCHQYMTSVSY
jgi:hypothetical protein